LADRPGGVVTSIAKNAFFAKPNPTTFSIEWLAKDLSYAKKFTQDLNLSLLDDVLEKYKEALDNGFGSEDWASINTLKLSKKATERYEKMDLDLSSGKNFRSAKNVNDLLNKLGCKED
jgi:hypothetical protein